MSFNPYLRTLTMALAALAIAIPGFAAQLVVTSSADDGAGSLRATVAMAADGDQIGFASSLDGATIQLTSGMITVDAAVKIAGDVTITSRNASRALWIDTDGTVELIGLTFSQNTAESGAALYVSGGLVSIQRCTFSANTATGAMAAMGGGAIYLADGAKAQVGDCTFDANRASGTSGSGGAIFNGEGSTLSANRTTFSNNTASRAGGAVEDASDMSSSFYDVTFTGNTASANPGNGGAVHVTGAANVDIYTSRATGNVAAAEGGAFWNGKGMMTVGDTEIANNRASGDDADQGGGGIYNLSGTLVLTGATTLSGNVADGAKGSGGGILNDAGASLEVYGAVLSGNNANRAGGGIEDASGAATTVRLADVTLSDNVVNDAPGNGGGLHVGGDGVVELHRGTVTGNTAGAEGGGLWNGAGRMLVLGTQVVGNTASGDDADMGGGGIYNDGGTLVVDNGANVMGNVASGASGSGGGIFNAEGGTVSVTNSSINNNRANRAGGGIEDASGVSTTLFNVTAVGNLAGASATEGAPGNGGFLHVSGAATVQVNQGSFRENIAAAEGGAFWNGTGQMNLDAVAITNNTAGGDDADQGGGGVYNNGGTLQVTSGTQVTKNTATGTSGSGGGIFNAEGGTLAVYGSVISENSANRAGGAIEDASGDGTVVKLFDVTASSNYAGSNPGNGGALHISGTGSAEIDGGSFTNNVAAAEGGALWNSKGRMLVNDAALSGNTANGDDADQGGGAVYNNGGTLDLRNVVVDGNTAAGASGSGGGVFDGVGGTTVVRASTISNNMANRAGGAIEDASNASLTLDDSEISGNYAGAAPGNGGGVHVTGTATVSISGTAFTSNTAASEGGGFWNGKGAATIQGGTFSDNTASGDDADQGGGAIYNLAGDLSVDGTQFAHNMADGMSGSGGAVLLDTLAEAKAISFSNAVFEFNSASRAGGAIEDRSFQGGNDVTEISRTRFSNNTAGAAPGNGGAIHITGDGDMDVQWSRFTGNSAANQGGALWNSKGRMSLTYVVAIGNSANGTGGGGVWNNGGTLDVQQSSLTRNNATTSTSLGGGLYNGMGGTATVSTTTISSNRSAFNGGGIVNAGTLTLTASTVADNTAANNGGGIGLAPTAVTATLRSTVVAYNTAPNRGSQVDVAGGSYVSGGYNLIASDDANIFPAGGTDKEGTADMPIDPLLGPLMDNMPGGPAHTPLCGSPLIDMGDPALTMDDQLGNPLVGVRDIGAIEFQGGNCATDPLVEDVAATFGLYPTVVSDGSLTVELEEASVEELITLQVLDAHGTVVYSTRAQASANQLALPGLTPGTYFVRVVSGQSVRVRSFSVAR